MRVAVEIRCINPPGGTVVAGLTCWPIEVLVSFLRFLLDKRTGSLTVHVNQGTIMETLNINEVIRGEKTWNSC